MAKHRVLQGVYEEMQKPPVTLDAAVALGEVEQLKKVLEELKKTLEQLAERLTKVETTLGASETGLSLKERVVKLESDFGMIETGYHIVTNALEVNGLMSAGEATKPAAKPEPRGEPWDPVKIKWATAEGSKGVYERSEDVNNPEFKKLLQDLGTHKGKLIHGGYFYWVFTNGTTVGRKKRKQS